MSLSHRVVQELVELLEQFEVRPETPEDWIAAAFRAQRPRVAALRAEQQRLREERLARWPVLRLVDR